MAAKELRFYNFYNEIHDLSEKNVNLNYKHKFLEIQLLSLHISQTHSVMQTVIMQQKLLKANKPNKYQQKY